MSLYQVGWLMIAFALGVVALCILIVIIALVAS